MGRVRDARKQRGIVIAVVAAVVTLVVCVTYVRSHPSPFPDAHREIAIRAPVTVGVPFYIGLVGEEHPNVKVTNARVVTDGAAVASGVSLCEPKPGAPSFGAAPGPLSTACRTTTGVIGRNIAEVGDAYLLMTVVALEPGSITVRGVRLTFEQGWRRGTQLTGPTARLTARLAE